MARNATGNTADKVDWAGVYKAGLGSERLESLTLRGMEIMMETYYADGQCL